MDGDGDIRQALNAAAAALQAIRDAHRELDRPIHLLLAAVENLYAAVKALSEQTEQ